MADRFDPYHQWLGISPREQPPNHYRLLAIELFEDDADVIQHAADQRMSHLRTFQTGKHGAQSQRLLNEVAAAKICLLDPKKKSAYDAGLRKELEKSSADESLDAGLIERLPEAEPHKATAGPAAAPSRRPKITLVIGLAAGVVVLALAAWMIGGREKSQVAVGPEPKAVEQHVTLPEVPQSPPVVKLSEPAPTEPPRAAESEKKASEPSKPPAAKPPALAVTSPTNKNPPAERPKPAAPAPKSAARSAPATPRPQATGVTSPPTAQPAKPESSAATSNERSPVPSGAALEQAKKAAADLFKTEVQKAKTSSDKVALARRLLNQAIDQPNAADKYALLMMAEELAVLAREADATFQAVDQIVQAFEVDRFAVKTEILVGWAKDARTADARKRIVEQMLAVGEEAIDAGELEAAKELGRLATAKASGLREVAQKMKAYRQRFTEAGKDAEELKTAQAVLAKDPKDAKASLVVGQYLCFTKGEWSRGLPLLLASSDDALKSLASQELASRPPPPEAQINLADAWWEFASARRPSQSGTIKLHAAAWYRQAAESIPAGLVKNKVDQRLREAARLRSQLSPPTSAVAPFDEKHARQHQQRWAEYLGEPVETTNSIGMRLVLIPPGEFDMGAGPEEMAAASAEARKKNDNGALERVPTEGPRHRVRISRPFRLGLFEVTQDEWTQVMGNNPSSFSANGAAAQRIAGQDTKRHPVEMVSWEDAKAFCERLSALPKEQAAGRIYRLPSEAEWEYACRAGTISRWYTGDDPDSLATVAWSTGNARSRTHPVGEKRPNAFGLFDMHGNVWEWCMDWYGKEYYGQSPSADPVGPTTGSSRVLRGGAWTYPGIYCRSACRYSNLATSRYHLNGLRLVMVVGSQK